MSFVSCPVMDLFKVNRVLAAQAQGPEFDPPEAT